MNPIIHITRAILQAPMLSGRRGWAIAGVSTGRLIGRILGRNYPLIGRYRGARGGYRQLACRRRNFLPGNIVYNLLIVNYHTMCTLHTRTFKRIMCSKTFNIHSEHLYDYKLNTL